MRNKPQNYYCYPYEEFCSLNGMIVTLEISLHLLKTSLSFTKQYELKSNAIDLLDVQ